RFPPRRSRSSCRAPSSSARSASLGCHGRIPAPMPQLIAVPRESAAGEKRVATVPDVVEKLVRLGFRVAVQSGAGDAANFADDTYRAAGAEIIDDAARLWAAADIVFKVRAPSMTEVGLMRAGSTLVSFVWPAQNPE